MTTKKWTIIQILSIMYLLGLVIGSSYFGARYYDVMSNFAQQHTWVVILILITAGIALLLFVLGFVVRKEGELNKQTVVTTVSMIVVFGVFLYFFQGR
ncbi:MULTISPECIES: hypothetical protein [Alteribacter]|uniref:Uncharacterized protein n=1 Tax=Alteribacter keqinensis TaxID=2483800 RepID=A0A3M7TN81_9BACI|nr:MULTISPECIES: hypothetical protein [Alteribacter]MBM7095054.1 hypothetical protein [Alteribacter salitolerans]RNA66848.1 hypothetical protein EBO34_16710 [Alteribacter keqinensis]